MSNELTERESAHIVAPPYTKLSELDDYTQRGAEVFSVQLNEIPVELLSALGTFLQKAETAKTVTVHRDYSAISVRKVLTAEEIQQRLDDANEMLASDRQKYLTAVQFGTGDEWDVKAAVKRFGKRAGLDTVLPVSV